MTLIDNETLQPVPEPRPAMVEQPCPYCGATGYVDRMYRSEKTGATTHVRGKCSACAGRKYIVMEVAPR